MKLRALLDNDGEIIFMDPCPCDIDGAKYFLQKQFPQGQFYIMDRAKYSNMLKTEYGLEIRYSKLIYGRPDVPLKEVRFWGNLLGLSQLLMANLFRRKPYMLCYNVRKI